MNKIITETIKIKCDTLPPKVDFIEKEIKRAGFEVLRYSIVDVKDNELTLSVSGRKI